MRILWLRKNIEGFQFFLLGSVDFSLLISLTMDNVFKFQLMDVFRNIVGF